MKLAAALAPFYPAEVRYDDRTRAGVIAVLDLLKR